MTAAARRPIGIAAALLLLLAPATSEGARPWEADMQRFERQDAEDPARPGGVVFVGSSSIRLWDLEASFGPGSATPIKGPLRNRGFGGSQMDESVDEVDLLVLRRRPRLVVVYAGDNDIHEGKTAERVAADFDRFVAAVHAELPETRLAYIAIKPSLARWGLAEQMRDANDRIARRCDEDPRLVFIDIWRPMLGADGAPRPELFVDDGLHLNDAGYRLWAAVVHAAVAGD